jgi:ABC-2 type transport system permease protein
VLALAGKAFRRTLAYRVAFWTELAINFLFMVLYVYLWQALTRDRPTVAGFDRRALLSYVVVAQTVMTMQFTMRVIWEIERKVRTGAIAVELLRPIDFQLATMATACGPFLHTVLFNMIPKLVVFAAAGVLAAPPSPAAAALFCASFLAGFVVQLGLEIVLGLLAFWLIEIRGITMLVNWGVGAVFSGYFAPLELYPGWLAAIGRALPFHAIIGTPSAMWTGALSGAAAIAALATQLAWAAALLLGGRAMLAVARRRLVVQGG